MHEHISAKLTSFHSV